MIGRMVTAGEVMEEIEKDRVFYEESGGGVTFSGGEPLMQPGFLHALLSKCKERKIHTALDTSGYVSWETLSRISANVDLFLYDIKHTDDRRHMELTGVSNRQIFHNLKNLAGAGKKIWIRVPVMPGLNDDQENMLKIADLMHALNLKDIFLLPYHRIATDKYGRLGRVYLLSDLQTPSDEYMHGTVERLSAYGLNVKIGG
ncbi:4-hydroxyphenylacetate decarboxylase activating enzyme [Thermotalea metallivorans]|uniref:4-hydroxyphenylacetate decarboxylase activating enzyme n=2 Tax=Thermotalea metallivorans TaxID=520762 RepID=A0A140L1N6_9FIRM|nr:4-hydroxyphenylacetate decarboxylase activating enzyme [Thermotalea metallivorans]